MERITLVLQPERIQESVAKSVAYHEHIDFRAPVERLRPVEQAAVHTLKGEVKPILNPIEAVPASGQEGMR